MDTPNDNLPARQQGLEPAVGYKELVEDFLASKSTNTLDAYRRDLEDFRRFVNTETGEETAQTLLGNGPGNANVLALRYKTSLTQRGLSPRTINRRLSALRSLVSLARRFGLVTWTLEVDSVKVEPYRDTRGPGLPAVKRLLAVASGNSPKNRRDTAILHLLYAANIRRGEVVALDVEDVDLETQTVAVRGKGKAEKRDLSIPPQTCQVLSLWLEARGSEPGPLFTNFDRAGKSPGGRLTGTSVTRLVRDLGKKAGVKARPHGLRHTAITRAFGLAAEHGYGIEAVQDYGRHASVQTTMIYRDRERDLQGEMARLVEEELE